uniref:Tetraspanin n=1 Tax=Setaria digitata TaxID=48799 RepID=A0A915PJQ0_9BILA
MNERKNQRITFVNTVQARQDFTQVLGLGSLLIGLWSYVTKQTYVDLIPSSYGTLSAVGLCIAAGLTVIIITFVGCLGVWIESRLLLFAYIFFIILLLVVQFVVSVLALNYQPDIYRRVRSDMEQSLKYHKEVFVSSQLTWDELQTVFLCCGVNGPKDWFGNQKWPNSSYVPDSCCNKIHFNSNFSMKNCGKGIENWDLWFQQGCSKVYTNWIFEEIKVAAYIAIVFICIEKQEENVGDEHKDFVLLHSQFFVDDNYPKFENKNNSIAFGIISELLEKKCS